MGRELPRSFVEPRMLDDPLGAIAAAFGLAVFGSAVWLLVRKEQN